MTRFLKRRLVTTARWLEAVAECAMSRLASSSWRMLEKRMATLLWLIVLCRESVLSEPGHGQLKEGKCDGLTYPDLQPGDCSLTLLSADFLPNLSHPYCGEDNETSSTI